MHKTHNVKKDVNLLVLGLSGWEIPHKSHSQRDDPESQYPSTTNQFNPLHIHHVSNIPLYSRLPIFFFKYSFCINSSTFNDRILFLQIEPETTALC